jgi:uncharacterized protein
MTRLRTFSTAVAWMPWSGQAFARAAAERRPVLLSLAAPWCAASREMDRTTFADPLVATAINEQFLPIRIDPDARPDIAARYGLGGWPTTSFLLPDGRVLGGGTFISAQRMPDVLRQVTEAFAAAPDGPRVVPPPLATSDGPARPPPTAADVLAACDPVHGGFGGAPKFPHAAALRLALAGSARDGRSDQDTEGVVRTLDAMGWGGLFDEAEGGFFHYAAGADWSAPNAGKRLDDQAALIRLYLDAGESLALTRFTARAADTVAFVQAWLADPEGGWFCARHAGDEAPETTPLYADANGAMASAALHAARVLEDDGLRQFALTSLERVLLACYRPGDGACHYHDGARRGRGLLADWLSGQQAAGSRQLAAGSWQPARRALAASIRGPSPKRDAEAGSGHPVINFPPAARPAPTSPPSALLRRDAGIRPLSAAEIRSMTPRIQHDNDRFVLSKGHAAPILYAAWAEAGAVPARRAAEAAAARLGPRGAPDAAAAVRGRRDRLARPGAGGRRRHRRSTPGASDPTTAPTC